MMKEIRLLRENNVYYRLRNECLTLAPFYENPQTEAFCKLLDMDKSKMPR
jgi:hypothetical protein